MPRYRLREIKSNSAIRASLAAAHSAEYAELRIAFGAALCDRLLAAGVGQNEAMSIASEVQTRMLNAADAYADASREVKRLADLLDSAVAAIRKAETTDGTFIID
jgi:hypothetical protein